MQDIVITKPSDLTFEIMQKHICPDDCNWIMFMLFLGKKWTIKDDMHENRKNVYLAMKEYWRVNELRANDPIL